MEQLRCEIPESDESLRLWSERGVMDPAKPVACRLCDQSFRNESAALAHISQHHGGLQRYRESFLSLEACQPHEVKGEEWRRILANFSEFSTQSARTWHEKAEAGKMLQVRQMSACCVCARGFWLEELLFAPFIGPDSPVQNPKSVARLLSAGRYHERWPLIPWSELEASSCVLEGERILLHTRRVPAGASHVRQHVFISRKYICVCTRM